MESGKQQPIQVGEEANNRVVSKGVKFVKMMTDEQIEILRKQISVYVAICEHLVDWHKLLTLQPDVAGNTDGSTTPSDHKITGRQKWTPTPVQLQILKRTFEQGTGTPSKQKIEEITSELSHHGQVSKTDVYSWFQDRRARSEERKQQPAPAKTAEEESETEIYSSNVKQTEPVDFQQITGSSTEDLCYQNVFSFSLVWFRCRKIVVKCFGCIF